MRPVVVVATSPRRNSAVATTHDRMNLHDTIHKAASFLKTQVKVRPRIALVLGSGLGDFADLLEPDAVISAADIPGYPVSSVPGHAGKLIVGTIRDGERSSLPLLIFKGRVHFYETEDLGAVVLPIAVASRLGCRTLLVTNAAGGINGQFRPGDLMLLRDLLNLSFARMPILRNITPSHRRLPDAVVRAGSGTLFDERLSDILRASARDNGIGLQEGTYCYLKGPTYESAAEIRMLRQAGADAVGMSTVPEILAAHQLKMRIAGVSLISNLATGISDTKLSHGEVTETADRVKTAFTALMKEAVLRIR